MKGIVEDDEDYFKRCYGIDKVHIRVVYYKSEEFIVYLNQDSNLSWHFSKLPDYIKWALSEVARIRALVDSCLIKSKAITAYELLAAGLYSYIINPKQERDPFNDVLVYLEENKENIKRTIIRNKQYSVYLTKSDTIAWWHNQAGDENVKIAQSEFESTRALAEYALPKTYNHTISSKLGSALSQAFSKDNKNDIVACFDDVKKFVDNTVENHVRIRIFITNSLSSLFFLMAVYILWLFDLERGGYYLCAGSGVIGALISSLQRNDKIVTSGYTSGRALYLESISRLIIGATFGMLLLLGVMSGLFLPLIKDNFQATLCLSFIAGFSERLVPDLISTVIKKQTE